MTSSDDCRQGTTVPGQPRPRAESPNSRKVMTVADCWLTGNNHFNHITLLQEPSYRACKPAYLVLVASQDNLVGLCQEGHPA